MTNAATTEDAMRYRAETLAGNGFVRVFDYACKWAALYRPTPTGLEYRGGGIDSPASRAAALAHLGR